jgi:hypothetical protein
MRSLSLRIKMEALCNRNEDNTVTPAPGRCYVLTALRTCLMSSGTNNIRTEVLVCRNLPLERITPLICSHQFINVMASVTFWTPTLQTHPLYSEADFCQQPGSVSALFSFIFSIITVISLLSSHYLHLFLFSSLCFVVWLPLL